MAILVNLGQRGFVLKEGLLAPGQSLTVNEETAETLSRAYPKELKVIQPEKVVEKPVVKAVKVEPVKEPEVKEEAPKAPKKRTYKRKAK